MAIDTYIERKRGDTYPIEAILTRDDEWVLTGSEIKMTMKFDDDVEHTFNGTVLSEEEKRVSFTPTSVAVDTVRKGVYDIQVDDGFFIATHVKDVVNIIEDVTP